MHHVAIMNPKWKLLPKVLSGEKTIESRWYKHRITPWNRISMGDTVYFKDAGKPVTLIAEVEQVVQFDNLTCELVDDIIKQYNYGLSFSNPDKREWFEGKKYCILIFIKNPREIKPFSINRKGFGTGAAWLTIENIESIKTKD